MPPRFYAPGLDPDSDRFSIFGDEARHLSRVLRLGPGAEVRVFDGRGLERAAVVDAITRDEVALRLGAVVRPARELPFPLTLVQALLKGDAMDAVVRDATMLGVAAVQPVLTERCEVPAPSIAKGGRQERWRRIAVASAKQCGRAVVPEIRAVLPLHEALNRAKDGTIVVLAEPSSCAGNGIRGLTRPDGAPVTVFVGPEGGWSEDELSNAASAGAQFVTLGERTLRADAAALVVLPVLLYAWDAL
ncbi:MAG TPA: RsmE family RNA methyltransferase [Vicinamibacterales bacterium]|nr:RsmE family RNA methyltransferase [Vicinamibacterales bacterium]